MLGGGGRGLGVVNLFALLYLTRVIGHAAEATSDVMYGALIVLSVPMPLLAGWLSDRIGRKPVIVGAYRGRGDRVRRSSCVVGSSLAGLWAGIFVMGLFSFAESPQLQALLADIAEPTIRDASFALYFTLAFGVGSLWTALYGLIIATAGEASGAADRLRADGGVISRRKPDGPAGAGGTSSRGVTRGVTARRLLSWPGPVQRASGRGVAQLGSAYRSGR